MKPHGAAESIKGSWIFILISFKTVEAQINANKSNEAGK